jgi:hypothetical protein
VCWSGWVTSGLVPAPVLTDQAMPAAQTMTGTVHFSYAPTSANIDKFGNGSWYNSQCCRAWWSIAMLLRLRLHVIRFYSKITTTSNSSLYFYAFRENLNVSYKTPLKLIITVFS